MSPTSPISWLPHEVLHQVFAHLDAPLDLYHASLVCCDWRSVGLDSQLWEPHYWRVYRAREAGELLERYEQKRHEAMRIWVKEASSLIPVDWLQAFLYPQAASGVATPFRPFLVGYLALTQSLDSSISKADLLKEMASFTTRRWGLQGPDDPAKATPELLNHLFNFVGRQPTAAELEHIDSQYDALSQRVVEAIPLRLYQPASSSTLSHPHFLRHAEQRVQLPDFHAAFLSRMNRDEELMVDLQQYILRQADLMEHMLRFVDKYGDEAGDLLAALAADQRVSAGTVADFAQHMIGTRDHGYDLTSDKLHALDVHTRAASQSPQPRPQDFLALKHAARHMLGHLQRREAVRSLRRLLASSETQSSVEWPLRQRVLDSCIGVEDSLQALGLFRSAEPSDVREYLDLLALHVWASLRSADHVLAARGLRSPETHSPSSQHGLTFCAREMATSILDYLLGLGFAVEGPGNRDANKNFIQSPLWNPSQRGAVVYTFLAIFCAVARRLGIPTTLVEVPGTVMALVIEDGQPPPGWTEENPTSQWQRFFVIPGAANERQPVAEYDQVEQWAATQRGAGSSDSNTAEFGTPMTPSRLLQGAASSIMSALDAARQGQANPPQNAAANDDAQSTETPTTPRDDVAALRAYLSRRQSSPPLPLWPALRPSTLALLPLHKAATAADDSEYAAAWACRLAIPESMGGVQSANALMAETWLKEESEKVAVDGAFQGDITLLFEVSGYDVRSALEKARQEAHEETRKKYQEVARRRERAQKRDGSNEREEEDPVEPEEPFTLQNFAAKLFSSDREASHGLGGLGVGYPGLRDFGRSTTCMTLNATLSWNFRVEHRIGTVFKHRRFGYYGAVIGWDKSCGMDDSWIELMDVDNFPNGGRKQPFYFVVTDVPHAHGRCYVPQCDVEPVRVPAGFTTQDAVAVLRELVPLLNHRTVGKCFRTLRIEPFVEEKEEAGGGEKSSAESGKGGQVQLVMNAWMRGAWPYG